MTVTSAICFVLANPAPDGFIDAFASLPSLSLNQIPLTGDATEPHFSSARRQGFGAGLRACVQSIRRRHRQVPPIVVLRPSPQQLTMADVDEVISFDPAPYASIPFTGTYWGPEIYFKLELFNLRGYERVVYLDCDTIALDDISPLWNMDEYAERSFYAVRESREMGAHPEVVGKFNTGVMVVNRPLLTESTHRRMLDIACEGTSYDGGDQGVINRYLNEIPGTRPGELDVAYNVLVCARRYGNWDTFKDRIRILHFTNRLKPWALDHQRTRSSTQSSNVSGMRPTGVDSHRDCDRAADLSLPWSVVLHNQHRSSVCRRWREG